MNRRRALLTELADQTQYWQRVKNMTPLIYMPLWEASGTAADDLMDLGDGTYNSVTLGQTGIGDGHTSPLFAGAATRVNIYTPLSSSFNGQEGAFICHVKVANAGVWSDATVRYIARFRVNSSNMLEFYMSGDGTLTWAYSAGGILKSVVRRNMTTTDWFVFGASWSKTEGYFKAYFNGVQEGETQTGVGTWTGALSSVATLLGSGSTAGAGGFSGYLAHAAIWTRPLSDAEHAKLNTRTTAFNPVFFGDSVTAGTGATTAGQRWANLVAANKNWYRFVNAGIGSTTLQNSVQNSVSTIGAAVDGNGRDTYVARVLAQNPTHVFILYGLNDLRLNDAGFSVSNFENDLGEIVDGLIAGGVPAANIVLGSPPHMTAYTSFVPWNGGDATKHDLYRDAAAAVATAKGTPYADVYQYMLDNGGDTLVGADGVHPNDNGHLAITTAMLNAT